MCGEEVHPQCQTCLHYTRRILTFLFSHIGLVSLVVGYCLVGAVTFEALEVENEREVKRNMTLIREQVTGELWRKTNDLTYLHNENWSSMAEETLKDFETKLLKAMKKDGWDGSEDERQVQWTFAGALFYSIIVITTIDYGQTDTAIVIGAFSQKLRTHLETIGSFFMIL